MNHYFAVLLVLALLCPSSLSSPIPNVEESSDQQAIDDVKDLEGLRMENNKPKNKTEANHEEKSKLEELEPLPTPLANSEEPQPNSRSAIFRHRGITQAKKSKYWNEKSQQPNDAYTKFPGIQYSPADLAAYVFNTGDEEGVAVAVEELVREGMMGRTDAINYLQDVKQILSYLRDQYEHQKKLEDFKNRAFPQALSQRFPLREQLLSEMDTDKRDHKIVEPAPSPVATTEQPHQVAIASTSEPKGPTKSASTTAHPEAAAENHKETSDKQEITKQELTKPESDKEESYKEEDFKRRDPQNSNSFTLEVIYKLAKDMFTQSILRDDPTAEDTLSGLVAFLESEVGNKRISPEMKEKVLEVVSAALVNSLREYQGYLSENQAPMFEESGLYQNTPDSTGFSLSKALKQEFYRKLSQGHENDLSLASKNNRPKSS